MKKITVFILFSLLSLAFFSGCSKNNSDSKKEVTVYTYDSFISEWGPGPEIADLFEQKTGIKVNYVDCGDGAQIFSKAVSEKSAPQSDVPLGLDNNLVYKARKEGILISFKPQNSEVILEGLESPLGNDWLLTPFDYSHFAIIFDSDSKYKMPSSLNDLCDKEYEGKIILMDPRTKTTGEILKTQFLQ